MNNISSRFNFQTVSVSKVHKFLISLNPRAVVPSEWKSARVIPLHKKGPKNLLNNYRPISILPVISKIFEKVLYEQLYDYFISNNLLSPHQFGFRQFHSTASALLDSTNEWFINMDRGMFNIAVFLDLQKAFDTINHDIMLEKLKQNKLYGLEEPSMNLLSSYLANRAQLCFVNGVLSGSMPISCGIPQGSILGPLLFLIYINDLPRSLEYSSPRMFADDTTLTVSGKSIQEIKGAINHDLANVKR